MATWRWVARCWADPTRRTCSSEVKASIRKGARTMNAAVVTARTTTARVQMAEMDRQASRSDVEVSRWMKTGMNVAPSTPPRTTS